MSKKVDVNFYHAHSGDRITSQEIDGSKYTDALKCSNVHDVYVEEVHVIGGSEDCVDINRGGEITFNDCIFTPTGKFAFTIKGGAHTIKIMNSQIGHGREMDIDLGNWSDQSRANTRLVQIENCTSSDDKPIRVRCLWASDPVIINSNVKLTRIHPIFLWFFECAKKLNLI